jgi:hypothetical protein
MQKQLPRAKNYFIVIYLSAGFMQSTYDYILKLSDNQQNTYGHY